MRLVQHFRSTIFSMFTINVTNIYLVKAQTDYILNHFCIELTYSVLQILFHSLHKSWHKCFRYHGAIVLAMLHLGLSFNRAMKAIGNIAPATVGNTYAGWIVRNQTQLVPIKILTLRQLQACSLLFLIFGAFQLHLDSIVQCGLEHLLYFLFCNDKTFQWNTSYNA